MPAIIEVKATLTYALRNPDCTMTSPEDLMRMAARRIEELEKENDDLCQALKQMEAAGLACAKELERIKTVPT